MVKRKVSEFVETWKGKGDEKQDTQRFWMDLFQKVLGIEYPAKHLMFEKKVRLEDSTRYIDAYIPETKVLIEQKGMKINLSKEELQSGGASLTPYNQARRYDNNLPLSEKARWIICCNFQRFEIHDMTNPLAEPEVVLLENLEKEYYRLQFLVDSENELGKHFKLFAGPTLNIGLQEAEIAESARLSQWAMWSSKWNSLDVSGWIGLSAGLRF